LRLTKKRKMEEVKTMSNDDNNKNFPFDNVIDLDKELPPPTEMASADSNKIFERIIEFRQTTG
jgi:hypothetical protein